MSQSRFLRGMSKRIQSGGAWHGAAACEILDTVTPLEAAATPVPGGHSIWVLVRHIAAWRRAVTATLRGEPIKELPKEVDFPTVDAVTPEAWQAAKDELQQSSDEFQAALAELTDEQLAQPSPGQKIPLAGSVQVLLQHDTYHLGQIALLKKLVRETAAAPGS